MEKVLYSRAGQK